MTPREPVGGILVPDEPPVACGVYMGYLEWLAYLSRPAFYSAARAGVFSEERLGPRGGWHYAVLSEGLWAGWAGKYRERVRARRVG